MVDHALPGAAGVAAVFLVGQQFLEDLPTVSQVGGLGVMGVAAMFAFRTQRQSQQEAYDRKSTAQADAFAIREEAQEEAWKRKVAVHEEIERSLRDENERLRALLAVHEAGFVAQPHVNVVVPASPDQAPSAPPAKPDRPPEAPDGHGE